MAQHPSTLQRMIDQSLLSVREGNSFPESLQPIQEWLEIDGFDDLIADLDEGIAVDIFRFGDGFFCDERLRDGLYDFGAGAFSQTPRSSKITNKHRIDFLRAALELLNTQGGTYGDGITDPTLHTYPLSSSDGMTAVLAYRIEIHGQAGPKVIWHGLWSDRASFILAVREQGLWLQSDLLNQTDEFLLSLWNRNSND